MFKFKIMEVDTLNRSEIEEILLKYGVGYRRQGKHESVLDQH